MLSAMTVHFSSVPIIMTMDHFGELKHVECGKRIAGIHDIVLFVVAGYLVRVRSCIHTLLFSAWANWRLTVA